MQQKKTRQKFLFFVQCEFSFDLYTTVGISLTAFIDMLHVGLGFVRIDCKMAVQAATELNYKMKNMNKLTLLWGRQFNWLSRK
jgi:hypothetical protein